MAFEGRFIAPVALAKLELPDRTVRLCDGGFCYFGGEKYTSRDSFMGIIAAAEAIREGVGELAPGARITFLPDASADRAALTESGLQNSRLRLWLGELNSDGKTVINAEPLGDLLWDFAVIRTASRALALDVNFIGRPEKLFQINEGNGLSDRFHQSVWPEELGMSNANGRAYSVAWGIASPPRGSTGSVDGGNYSGGGFAREANP